MILSLGEQTGVAPPRVGGGLRMAHVDGPRRGKRNQIEHASPEPFAIVAFPEHRMAAAVLLNPFPVRWDPPLPIVVSTRLDELQERRVGDVMLLGFERPDVFGVC